MDKKNKNKFVTNLSKEPSGILEKRAKILSTSAQYEAEEIKRKKEKEINDLEMRLMNLTDLSPDNTYSLRPGGPDFNPEKWVQEMYNINVQLLNKRVELQVISDIIKEWFDGE